MNDYFVKEISKSAFLMLSDYPLQKLYQKSAWHLRNLREKCNYRLISLSISERSLKRSSSLSED